MDFFEQLSRHDLPAIDYPFVRRATRLSDKLLGAYARRFFDRLKPMKPIALVNGMPAYDLTQPPLDSAPGARVLHTGFEYVFLKRKARPITMVVMLNSACNMHCRHCSARNYIHSGRRPLDTQELKALVDQFIELNGASVIFSGGEPTLHPNLLELIDYVPKDKAVVAMFTNGWNIPDMASELRGAGLFGTLVSIDSADPDTHDRCRGKEGAFRQGMKALESLEAEGMLAGVSSYMTKPDLLDGGFDRILHLADRMKAHQLFLFDTVPTGALLNEKELLLHPEDRANLRELVKKQNASPTGPAIMGQSWVNSAEGFGCFAGFYQLYVTASGEVTPCDFTPVSFGNVAQEPLDRIWDRMRASPEWGVRHSECRMQDPAFRARTTDLLPQGEELPVRYERLEELRGGKGV